MNLDQRGRTVKKKTCQDYVDISQASQARMIRGGWALLRKILWEKKEAKHMASEVVNLRETE